MSLRGYTATATYVYTDQAGEPVLRSIRYEHPEKGKTFRQSSWSEAEQAWVGEVSDSVPKLLYRHDEVAASTAPFIVFVEGEKDVERLWSMGIPATTSPMGAGKAARVTSWECLRGKHVVIVADNDAPGQQHAQQVADILKPIVASLRGLTMPDVPPKGDFSDWADAGGTAEEFRKIVEACFTLQLSADPSEEEEVDPARVFVERAFLCSAWDHWPTAQVLATFPPARWKDPVARAAAAAISSLLKRDEGQDSINPLAVGLEMKALGAWDNWSPLEEFHSRRLAALGLARGQTYRAFREACNWDDARAFSLEIAEDLGKGDFRTWVQRNHEKLTAMLAQSETTELKTLRQHVEEWIEEFLEGKKERKTYPLAHISDVIGEVGGGDVVIQVGAPKTGKSSVLMDQIVTAAERGIKSLVGDLEMRMEQIVKRAVAKILRKPISQVTPADAARLLESGQLKHLDNIYHTSRCRSRDKYRAEVCSILAKHRDIKIWATDYAECLQNFGDGANRVDESEAIAKMVKDIAVAFDVTAILMIQPNQKYTEEGARGPRTTHAKNSSKWEQDAQAMIFIHSPARFFKDMPREYVELHVLCSRDSDTGIIPLKWEPVTYAYERWKGPVPAGGGRSLQQQTRTDRHADPLPEFEELEIPL